MLDFDDQIYRNFHEGQTILVAYHFYKKCFSVRDAQTKRIIGYLDFLVLKNAQFIVSQAGRARVLRENRKNVHAYIRGDFDSGLQNHLLKIDVKQLKQAYYNPYKTDSFVNKESFQPILSSNMVFCIGKGEVYYIGK
ncbi:hypothetical protein [Paenibacillus sp. OAS669]|uniref:hypothetical protein n=1 Tax=Paenibacillus sp. OAS669 TaxID=2663821 RepID=UPI00178BC2BC|nr:hypothetical protein [Paenibacillus sp. OAS669]MBE1444850.1 hypothetical protein [Paenibacillus sp. OAS669]